MQERPWHRHYPPGVPRSLDYEPLTVVDFLRRTAERLPHRPALHFLSRSWTWGALVERVERCAAAFAGLGVGPGSTVAILLPNLPQTVVCYQAALWLGARVVMTNPLYTEREIEHQWRDAEVDLAVVADWLYAARVAPARESLPRLRHVVATGIPDWLPFPLRPLAALRLRLARPPLAARVPRGSGVRRLDALLADAPARAPRPPLALEDVAVLQYTGGTTGPSKGAMLTHRNLSANVQQLAPLYVGMEYGREVVQTCLPLFHVFGMTVCMNYAVFQGAAMALVANPRDVRSVVKSIERRRATIFPGVPALYNMLNHHPGIERADLTSVKVCLSGSAPIPVDVQQRFEELTGARIIEGFGMSETSPVTHANPMVGLRKLGTIGIPVCDTDARVVDPEDGGRELPPGETGELVVRGPQVMAGYWRQPEETAQALRDGWMHTGDLATMDEDGYFKIVGRKKEMINVNGMKVYPDEVDRVLMADERVLEAATIGLPDAERGELVKSFVVRKPGAALDAEGVRALARASLASYKVPREVEFLDELPKSSVLKVLRRELRERERARGRA